MAMWSFPQQPELQIHCYPWKIPPSYARIRGSQRKRSEAGSDKQKDVGPLACCPCQRMWWLLRAHMDSRAEGTSSQRRNPWTERGTTPRQWSPCCWTLRECYLAQKSFHIEIDPSPKQTVICCGLERWLLGVQALSLFPVGSGPHKIHKNSYVGRWDPCLLAIIFTAGTDLLSDGHSTSSRWTQVE